MAGPYLRVKWDLGPAVKGALGAIVGWPWSHLVSRNLPVAAWEALPYWQGFGVRPEQGMGCV